MAGGSRRVCDQSKNAGGTLNRTLEKDRLLGSQVYSVVKYEAPNQPTIYALVDWRWPCHCRALQELRGYRHVSAIGLAVFAMRWKILLMNWTNRLFRQHPWGTGAGEQKVAMPFHVHVGLGGGWGGQPARASS